MKGINWPRDVEYRFLDFVLVPDQARLLKGADDIPLAPKPFWLLLLLAQAANRLVERDHLLELIWQGGNASDESLAQVVSQCRRALGDSAAQQAVIKTVTRRGYRLVPLVTVALPPPLAACWPFSSNSPLW